MAIARGQMFRVEPMSKMTYGTRRPEQPTEIYSGRVWSGLSGSKSSSETLNFFPSKLAFILGVSHAPNFFRMTPPWPLFGLDRFSSLVSVHLRSNVVRVCSSFWSVVMANSLVVHIMLKERSEVSPKLQFR